MSVFRKIVENFLKCMCICGRLPDRGKILAKESMT